MALTTFLDFEAVSFSAVDNSLGALRRSQRQHDPNAEAAIHQFETLCSPIVGTLSTIQTKTAQKFAKIDDLSDRLREPLARLFEVNENVRRRALDDKPIDNSDLELASSLQERIDVIMAIMTEYKADFDSSGGLTDIPKWPVNIVAEAGAISEALRVAVQVVQRPR
jgi:hypothetical protein